MFYYLKNYMNNIIELREAIPWMWSIGWTTIYINTGLLEVLKAQTKQEQKITARNYKGSIQKPQSSKWFTQTK